MLSKKEMLIVSNLRRNARMSLTEISKHTGIPISTIFDKLKQQTNLLIKKHTSLIDFDRLGFNTRINMLVKIDRDKREELKEYLKKNFNVNSLYRVNTAHDFLVECVFRDIREMEQWQEKLEDRFKIRSKQVYFVVDELIKEEFLAQPALLDVVLAGK